MWDLRRPWGLRCQRVHVILLMSNPILLSTCSERDGNMQGAVFAGVGFAAGLVGTAMSNGLLAARKKLDPEFKSQNEAPDVALNAATWAAHMGVSSNLRYQVLNGIDMARPAWQMRSAALQPQGHRVGTLWFFCLGAGAWPVSYHAVLQACAAMYQEPMTRVVAMRHVADSHSMSLKHTLDNSQKPPHVCSCSGHVVTGSGICHITVRPEIATASVLKPNVGVHNVLMFMPNRQTPTP